MRSVFVSLAAVCAGAQLALAEPRWPAVGDGYTFTAPSACQLTRATAEACTDQMARFADARASAAAAGKSLLVVFGATWCPSCKGLKTALPESLSDGLAARVQIVEITISTLVDRKIRPVPSGEAVYQALKVARPGFQSRAIPFIALVEPVSGRTSARNLDDLEQAGGWNRAALARAIDLALIEANGGASAPSEPGWLRRKWMRWVAE